jgi:hypothetical protein
LFRYSETELHFHCFPARCYDVAPDGRRFFVTRGGTFPPPSPVTHIHLVQNWLEEVKARVPTDR